MLGYRFKNGIRYWKASTEKWLRWNNMQSSIHSLYENVSVKLCIKTKQQIKIEVDLFFLYLVVVLYLLHLDLKMSSIWQNRIQIVVWIWLKNIAETNRDSDRCKISGRCIMSIAIYFIERRTGFIDNIRATCIAADHISIYTLKNISAVNH